MKLFLKFAIALFLIAFVFFMASSLFNNQGFALSFHQKPTLLIDPGHGGMDGGAVSKQNVSEKNINLAIALKLETIAKDNGWKVVMTRTEDVSLGSLEGSIRSQKMADLAARKKIIDNSKADAAISIHLNSFPQDTSCRGAQVFFPSEQDADLKEKSQLFAETIQAKLIDGLDIKKGRIPMEKSNVYIFKRPVLPITLVECGFLSNPDEENMLQQDEYQFKIAACIFKGLEAYYAETTGKNVSINTENIIISDFDDSSLNSINQGE